MKIYSTIDQRYSQLDEPCVYGFNRWITGIIHSAAAAAADTVTLLHHYKYTYIYNKHQVLQEKKMIIVRGFTFSPHYPTLPSGHVFCNKYLYGRSPSIDHYRRILRNCGAEYLTTPLLLDVPHRIM